MMETIKGIARRTTQSLRERVSGTNATPPDPHVAEVAKKVHSMEAASVSICEKVIRVARLMEELGVTLKEIGEEYRLVPDLAMESRQLAEDVEAVGGKLMETSREHQKGLKDNGFDVLQHFARECKRLSDLKETERHHKLEYDFFKDKVTHLRQSPQKDFTRIPRNEQILENWRVELWRASEGYKALLSKLYVDGRRAIDLSVLTTIQVLNSFVDIAAMGFKQTFCTARLPEYPAEPVLAPAPLPPNPLPPQSQLAIANAPHLSAGVGGGANLEGSTGSPSPAHPSHDGRSWGVGGAGTHSSSPPPLNPSDAHSGYTGGGAGVGQLPPPSGGYSSQAYAANRAPPAPAAYQPPPVDPALRSAAPPSLTEAYQPPRL